MNKPHFPRRGESVTVNGRQNPCAHRHERTRGDQGIVTSIDDIAACHGLPSISVMFDTPSKPDGTKFELFYPMEISTEEPNDSV